ncbi:MAG: hypothetical protein ACI857_000983 [Arenicella sp.]|jgi:hypothetical protein
MSKVSILLVFYSLAFSSFSQQYNQVKTFEGFYRGDDLKIQCQPNPITPWTTCDCIDSVVVNNKRLKEINIDGDQLKLNAAKDLIFFEEIKISLFYSRKFEMRIINPNDFFPKEILGVSELEIDSNNFIRWQTLQNHPDILLWAQVEQKKWGEWIKLGPNFNITEETKYKFDTTPYLSKGPNEFRVAVASIDYDHIPSRAVIIEIKKKKAKAKYKKRLKKIVINQKVDYLFYDHKNDIISRGFSSEINVSELEKGDYHLHYSNRQYFFSIK